MAAIHPEPQREQDGTIDQDKTADAPEFGPQFKAALKFGRLANEKNGQKKDQWPPQADGPHRAAEQSGKGETHDRHGENQGENEALSSQPPPKCPQRE